MSSEATASPFDVREYEQRLERIVEELRRGALDALIVSSPENICYISGYHTPGYHVPQFLVVRPDAEPFFVVRDIELDNVETHSWLHSGYPIHDLADAGGALAAALSQLLPAGSRVGYEAASLFLPPTVLDRLRESAPGCELMPTRGVVELARTVKSPSEIQLVRAAARTAERALLAGAEALSSAATDSDVAAAVHSTLAQHGSEYTGSPPYVVGGAASATTHATHARRPLGKNANVWLEISASNHRYHGAVSRVAVRGRPDPALERAFDVSARALEAMIAAIRPGATSAEVDRAGRELVSTARVGDPWTNRAGYSMGIAFPPGLGESGVIDIKPGDQRSLAPGMTFHLIPIIDLPGIGAVGCTETVLVTKDGCESLATLPRELILA